jgi:hypothetical protein
MFQYSNKILKKHTLSRFIYNYKLLGNLCHLKITIIHKNLNINVKWR